MISKFQRKLEEACALVGKKIKYNFSGETGKVVGINSYANKNKIFLLVETDAKYKLGPDDYKTDGLFAIELSRFISEWT